MHLCVHVLVSVYVFILFHLLSLLSMMFVDSGVTSYRFTVGLYVLVFIFPRRVQMVFGLAPDSSCC